MSSVMLASIATLLFGWIVVGFVAYGIYKGICRNGYVSKGRIPTEEEMRHLFGANWRERLSDYCHTKENERECRIIFLLGPLGLLYSLCGGVLISIVGAIFFRTGGAESVFGFCIRMPKELCERR